MIVRNNNAEVFLQIDQVFVTRKTRWALANVVVQESSLHRYLQNSHIPIKMSITRELISRLYLTKTIKAHEKEC